MLPYIDHHSGCDASGMSTVHMVEVVSPLKVEATAWMHAYMREAHQCASMRVFQTAYRRLCCQKPQQQRLLGRQSDHPVAASLAQATPSATMIILRRLTLCSRPACAALHPMYSIWQSARPPSDICRMNRTLTQRRRSRHILEGIWPLLCKWARVTIRAPCI